MRFACVLCLEGVETDDARLFDRFETRELPLTLYAQFENAMGHDAAPVVGNIVEVRTQAAADAVEAAGIAVDGGLPAIINTDDESPDGQEYARMLQAQTLNGISVDYTARDEDVMVECTQEDEEGWCEAVRIHYAVATVAAATGVGVPAFAGARVASTPMEEPAGPPADDTEEPVTASGSTTLQRSTPGLRLRPRAAAMPDAAGGHPLVAAAGVDLLRPPAAWFADPQLSAYTPLHINDDGEVVGHAAPWNGCHIGFSDRCVPPPRSSAGYGHYRTGQREVIRADGTAAFVRTGVLTVGADHAPTRGPGSSAAAARDHYANSALGWADVAAGEDRHGIWLHGALRPGVTSEQLVTLRALAPSGDWRRIDGRHELVAVLMVNTPGFRQPDGLAAGAQVVDVSDEAIIITTPQGLAAAGGCTDCDDEQLRREMEAVVAALGSQARTILLDRLRGTSAA